MPTIHGNSGVVHIAANAVAEVTNFTLELGNVDYPQKTAMGAAGHSYQTGGPEANSGELTCHYDNTDTNGQAVLLPNTELAAVFYPNGNASGEPRISGTILVQNRSRTQNMADVVNVTFPFLFQGTVTEDLVPV